LARDTSFVLTIYTIPYSQGHTGLQDNGNPLASAPFLLDKVDASPVYSLMHQSFSDNRQKSHIAETAAVPTLTATDTDHGRRTLHQPPPRDPEDYGPRTKRREMSYSNGKR